MRFELSADQVAFRDAVRELLAKECTPAVVRAAWTAPAGRLDRGVWDSLDAMGVLGLLVPEADGGLGLDETFLVPVLEECGRAALPHPLVETAMVAAPLVGHGAGMVSSDLGGPLMPCAADADVLLLRREGALGVLDVAAASLAPAPTVDGARRAARLEDHPAPPPPPTRSSPAISATGSRRDPAAPSDVEPRTASERHPAPPSDVEPVTASGGGLAPLRGWELVTDDPAAVGLAVERGALGTAALLVGLGQAMLDMTVAYVKDRHQFGVPIGSFQAVKHHLADAALALELARPALWRAAWSIARDEPTRTRDVSMAKAMASDAAQLAGRKALQCHGAIGYTVEADLHLYLKRTWALARTWGDTAFHTDRVATALGIPC